MKAPRIIIISGIVIALGLIALFIWKGGQPIPRVQAEARQEKKSGKKGGKKDQKETRPHDTRVTISRSWDMPDVLKEVSGIAWIDDSRFACVQDELGEIFIFNTASKQVEKQIPFGTNGDYEGIALVGNTAFVLRADGQLFEVENYHSGKPRVVQYKTHLTAKQDVEGLCYDPKNNRLLLANKGDEPGNKDYKGIYAFNLSTKELSADPVIRLSAPDNAGQGKEKLIEPSDLQVHPSSGDLYIIDGPNSKLVILGPDGTHKTLYQLGTKEFPQPEGIAFNKSGELYVSNEGKNGTGNILQLTLSRTP